MNREGQSCLILCAIFASALALTACSKPESAAEAPSRPFLQTRLDLTGKYGQPIRKRNATKFASGEQLYFTHEKLSVSAEFADDECHYISYKLPHRWTDTQKAAALSANGTGWSEIISVTSIMPQRIRFIEYQSSEGHYARYSPVSYRLEIYSTRVVAGLRQQEHARRRREFEMPKF